MGLHHGVPFLKITWFLVSRYAEVADALTPGEPALHLLLVCELPVGADEDSWNSLHAPADPKVENS